MPRTLKRRLARRPYIEGTTAVCDWQLEQALVRGRTMHGPLRMLHTRDDWRRAWGEWRDVILPKCIEHRPGTRPFACYACGEIEPRELRIPLPPSHGWTLLEISDDRGNITTHYLDVPEPFIDHEARYLYWLGIVSDHELRRYREWMRRRDDGDTADPYPLAAAFYE